MFQFVFSFYRQLFFKVPKNFKPLTNRAQKMFRKLLDPEPAKRLELGETVRFMEDKWLRKGASKTEPGKDGQSQLTLGSFQVKINIFVNIRFTFYIYCRVSIRICVRKTTSCTHFFNTAWRQQLTDRVKITGS